MVRECWASDEQSYEETNDLVTWGRCIGIHGGSEDQAVAAMERGEVTKVKNLWRNGLRFLYKIFSASGCT